MTLHTGSTNDEKRQCVADYREHLGPLLHCTHRIFPTMRFDKGNSQHLAAICLYATIFQSIGECYRLMDQPTVTVPGTMRSILESYADLCAVIQDREYPKKMLATLHKEQKRHLEDVIKEPQNPFHAKVATKIDPKEKLAEATNALDKLREKGHLPMRVEDRFKAARLTDLYRTIYWELSLHGHNNLAALEARHIRRTGRDQFEIDVFAANSAHQMGTSYDALIAMLADCSRRLYQLLDFAPPTEFTQRVEEFERFRPGAVKVLSEESGPA